MKLSSDELQALLHLVGETRPDEIDCDEFLSRVAAYVDASIPALPTDASYDDLRHHLRVCPECLEEFEALVEGLRDDRPEDNFRNSG